MKCQICGKSIPILAISYQVGDKTICRDCLSKTPEAKANVEKMKKSQSEINIKNLEHSDSLNYKKSTFRALIGFGSFYSVVGIFVILLGILGIILGFTQKWEVNLIIVVSGIFSILSGLGFLLIGQVVKCMVSIENNTRLTFKVLENKL